MKWRADVTDSMARLQSECGLGDTANIKQCVRVIIQRLASAHDITGLALSEEDGVSVAQGGRYRCDVWLREDGVGVTCGSGRRMVCDVWLREDDVSVTCGSGRRTA